MKQSHIILALFSPFILVSLLLASPFYWLHRAIDDNAREAK